MEQILDHLLSFRNLTFCALCAAVSFDNERLYKNPQQYLKLLKMRSTD